MENFFSTILPESSSSEFKGSSSSSSSKKRDFSTMSESNKKDFSTAILDRKKAANRLVVDEAINDDNSVVTMNPQTLGRRTMTTTTTMKPFPLLELFLHVLTRLPLKYLMRLRCVSKFFLDLTNNPNFITSYRKSNPPNIPLVDFNFMDTTTSSSSSSLVVSSQWQWQCPWRFHVLFKGSNYIYSHKHHELIPFHCPTDKRLISSMNGLVCFGGLCSIEIYNILAGTNYNLISPSPTRLHRCSRPCPPPVLVFGYDPISNDYKILSIERIRPHAAIYSFRTNSWKPMIPLEVWNCGTIFVNSDQGRSVCINGIIYWPPGDHNEIVLFDLHKEKFSKILLPEDDLLLPTQYADIQLLSFRGCLAFAFIQKTSSETTPNTKRRKIGEEEEEVLKNKYMGEEGDKPLMSEVHVWNELYNRERRGGVISEEAEKTINNWAHKCTKILRSDSGEANEMKYLWNRESFVVAIPPHSKEVEIVSCCDEIFLGWFESNQLRLYNVHTKCLFDLPLSSPLHYYPKVSFVGEKENDPTYVDNLSFDFSLI